MMASGATSVAAASRVWSRNCKLLVPSQMRDRMLGKDGDQNVALGKDSSELDVKTLPVSKVQTAVHMLNNDPNAYKDKHYLVKSGDDVWLLYQCTTGHKRIDTKRAEAELLLEDDTAIVVAAPPDDEDAPAQGPTEEDLVRERALPCESWEWPQERRHKRHHIQGALQTELVLSETEAAATKRKLETEVYKLQRRFATERVKRLKTDEVNSTMMHQNATLMDQNADLMEKNAKLKRENTSLKSYNPSFPAPWSFNGGFSGGFQFPA